MKQNLSKEILRKAKDGDDTAILSLVESFEKTVNILTLKYSVNGYEKDDLVQESNIAILNALKKVNIDDDNLNFNSYIITSITNNFYNLIKNKSKYNNEINLTTFSNENTDFINSVADDYSLEDEFIDSVTISSLHYALCKLSTEELDLAKHIYYNKLPLTDYCKKHNISYKIGRTKLKKLLNLLKTYII